MIIKNKYYLYCHLCNQEPFYIGIGSKKKGEGDYSRAYSILKSKRNELWWNIYSNCKDFEISIWEETNSKDQISFYEKAYIWELGRRHVYDDGYLVNIQAGGYKSKFSYTKFAKYDLNGNLIQVYNDVYSAANSIDVGCKAIYRAISSKATSGGFLWRKYTGEEKIEKYEEKRKRKVNQYDKNMNLLNSYESASEAGRQTNTDKSSIINVCLGKRKAAGKFIWKYDNGYSLPRID